MSAAEFAETPGFLLELCYDGSMIQIVALLLFFLQGADPAVLPDIPGVYSFQNGAGWIAMKIAPVVEIKTQGMKTFVYSGGYTNLGVNIVFKGQKASLRIPDSLPRFYIRKAEPAKDAIIVCLTQKGNQRACQTYPSGATSENKNGFKKEDVIKMAVSKNPDGSFLMTPESALKPGEYLLVMGNTSAIYDFGID